MMQTTENRIHLSHHDPRYGPKYAASSKNGQHFFVDFSDFYLAVSASVNDANYRKPNSFITPMTRDRGEGVVRGKTDHQRRIPPNYSRNLESRTGFYDSLPCRRH